jgi:hypothetical protein
LPYKQGVSSSSLLAPTLEVLLADVAVAIAGDADARVPPDAATTASPTREDHFSTRRTTAPATHHLTTQIRVLKMWDLGPAERARAWALQAQAREIDAHRRAINLQESSAVMFDRAHQAGRSRNARQRADHAREMLLQALAERDHFEKRAEP